MTQLDQQQTRRPLGMMNREHEATTRLFGETLYQRHRRFLPFPITHCLCFGFWIVVTLAILLQCVFMFAVYFHDDDILKHPTGKMTQQKPKLLQNNPPDWLPVATSSITISSSRLAEIVTWTTVPSQIVESTQTAIETSHRNKSTTSKIHQGPLSSAVLKTFRSIDAWIDQWTPNEVQFSNKSIKSTLYQEPFSDTPTQENDSMTQPYSIYKALSILERYCGTNCSHPVEVLQETLPDGLLRPASLRLFVDDQNLFISRMNWHDRQFKGHPSLEIVSGNSIFYQMIRRAVVASLHRYEQDLNHQMGDKTQQEQVSNISTPHEWSGSKVLPRLFTAVLNRLWNMTHATLLNQQNPAIPLSMDSKPNCDGSSHERRLNEKSESLKNHSSLKHTKGSEKIQPLYKIGLRDKLASHDLSYWRRVAGENISGSDWIVGHTSTGEMGVAYRWQLGEIEEWRLKLLMRRDRCTLKKNDDGFLSLDFQLPGTARVSELTIADQGIIYSRLGDTVQFRISAPLSDLCGFSHSSTANPRRLPVKIIGPPPPEWSTWHTVTSLSALRFPKDDSATSEFLDQYHAKQRDHYCTTSTDNKQKRKTGDEFSKPPQAPLWIMTSSIVSWNGKHASWGMTLYAYKNQCQLETANKRRTCVLGCGNAKVDESEWTVLFSSIVPSKESSNNWWQDLQSAGFERMSLAALVTGRFPVIETSVVPTTGHSTTHPSVSIRTLLVDSVGSVSIASMICNLSQCHAKPLIQTFGTDLTSGKIALDGDTAVVMGYSPILPALFRRSHHCHLFSSVDRSSQFSLDFNEVPEDLEGLEILSAAPVPSQLLMQPIIEALEDTTENTINLASKILGLDSYTYLLLLLDQRHLALLKIPLEHSSDDFHLLSLDGISTTWNTSSTEVRLLIVQLCLCLGVLLLDRVLVRIVLRPLAHQRPLRSYS